jgi:enoyl-CoA hydratase/carnithine racemase
VNSNKQCVDWTREDGIATITINNPPVNVISKTVREELSQCLDEIEADGSIRVIILTGAGRAFMAGADIKELPQFRVPGAIDDMRRVGHKGTWQLERMPQVTIAAINGLALGGGCELALACDMRVASEDAKLGLPEINLGLLPGGGGTQRLPRLIGRPLAKELMFTGEPIGAQEALRIGLINKLAPPGQALALAQELARKIATKSGATLRLLKDAIDRGYEKSLEEGMAIEASAFDQTLQLEDSAEGIEAFLNKRPPQFKHR